VSGGRGCGSAVRKPAKHELDEQLARLEARLSAPDLPLFDWLAAMNDLRELAARDDVSGSIRIRFARRWLESGVDTRRLRRGGLDNDRAAYLWAVSAAHRGHSEGQLLLGHCYRHGRGAPRSRQRSRFWYRRAAASGSSEARFWLRYTQLPTDGWLLYRGTALGWIGLGLLAIWFVSHPPAVLPIAVACYVAIMLGGQLLIGWSMTRIAPGDPEPSSGTTAVDSLMRRPWELLAVAGEDGLVLVPLLWLAEWIGFPVVAPVAGMLFGVLHYPNFSWRKSAAKGITYALAVALILPWGGLGSMVAGHVVLDAAIVLLRLVMLRRQRGRESA
jgi:hypothetical protein